MALLVITGPQATQQPPYTPLADASGKLQEKGVDVIVMGIGVNIQQPELEAVASRQMYVFRPDVVYLPVLSSVINFIIRQGKLAK